MAEQFNDIVHVIDVNRQQMATGDGRSRLYPFSSGTQTLVPTVIRAVFIGDWQGAYSQIYPFARTNQLTNSWSFTEANGWQPMYVNPSVLDADALGPNNMRGRVFRMRLGDCTGGPSSSLGGFYAPDTSNRLTPNLSYVASLWVRASAPVKVHVNAVDSDFTTPVQVTTEWQRISASAPVGDGGAERMMTFLVDTQDNADVDPDTQIFYSFAQVEQSFDFNALGRYIPTNGAPVTFTDYRVSDGNLLTTDPVLNGAPIYWTGTGYWLESPTGDAPIATDLLANVTWSYDQAERLLSLLRSKQAWYASNHDEFWKGWNERIFQLKTANTFGIAVWAFILNVPLTALSLRDRFRYFAFGPFRENFTNSEGEPVNPSAGNFPPISQGGQISTPKEKIQALRLRYYALTSDCSITSINKMLTDVFADEGLCFVQDNEDMSMEYVFTFPVSLGFRQSMIEYGLLPKPAGVKITITAP